MQSAKSRSDDIACRTDELQGGAKLDTEERGTQIKKNLKGKATKGRTGPHLGLGSNNP